MGKQLGKIINEKPLDKGDCNLLFEVCVPDHRWREMFKDFGIIFGNTLFFSTATNYLINHPEYIKSIIY